LSSPLDVSGGAVFPGSPGPLARLNEGRQKGPADRILPVHPLWMPLDPQKERMAAVPNAFDQAILRACRDHLEILSHPLDPLMMEAVDRRLTGSRNLPKVARKIGRMEAIPMVDRPRPLRGKVLE